MTGRAVLVAMLERVAGDAEANRRDLADCKEQMATVVGLIDLHSRLSIDDAAHVEASIAYLDAKRRITGA